MKNVVKIEYKRFLIISLASVIYSLGLIWFLQPGSLYSGGVVGLVQLILNIIAKATGETYAIGVFIFVINIPLLYIAFKYVSFKFAIYSLLSIVIQSIMGLGFINVIDFQINVVGEQYNQLMLALIGGGMIGIGGALALRFGGSTGGLDIIAQAFALKKELSIGVSSLIFNFSIALIGGFVLQSWAIVFYTIIRIVVTSIVTDKIHTIYNHLKVEIITEKGEEISSMIMRESGHGVTVVNAEGGYTHKKKFILEIVLSSFQLYPIIELAKEIDPNVFIITTPVKRLVGNFKKRTIA
ncbi:MAG: YitT family protein [bacterium]